MFVHMDVNISLISVCLSVCLSVRLFLWSCVRHYVLMVIQKCLQGLLVTKFTPFFFISLHFFVCCHEPMESVFLWNFYINQHCLCFCFCLFGIIGFGHLLFTSKIDMTKQLFALGIRSMFICICKYMHFYVFTFDNIRVFQRVCACVYVRASMHTTVLIMPLKSLMSYM